MQKIAEITHPATSDHLVLNLWRHSDGSTFVSSVEVIDKKSRLRLSCCERTRPQDVFSKEVFEKLTYVFQQCSDLRGFLSLPDLKLSVGDLVLVGCRIMVSATKSGVEQVLVRFSKCYGKFNTLFRPEFRHRDSFASEGVERAVDALEKIYLPLIEICFCVQHRKIDVPLHKVQIQFL